MDWIAPLLLSVELSDIDHTQVVSLHQVTEIAERCLVVVDNTAIPCCEVLCAVLYVLRVSDNLFG